MIKQYRTRKVLWLLGAAGICGFAFPAIAQMVIPNSKPVSPEKLFGQQCGACHSTAPGETRVGPSLANIFDRKAGRTPGYNYSPALKKSGLTWTRENLNRWLADSNSTVRGTTMAYKQVDAAKRRQIIDYLATLSGN